MLTSAMSDKTPQEKNNLYLKQKAVCCDPAVAKILGDTVAKIIFESQKAIVYRLDPVNSPKDGENTIGGVKIVCKDRVLSRSELESLKLMLADSSAFTVSVDVPLCTFSPLIGVEFRGKYGSVSLLFSLLSHEIGVVNGGELKGKHQFGYTRLATRLLAKSLDKEYYDYLMHTIK